MEPLALLMFILCSGVKTAAAQIASALWEQTDGEGKTHLLKTAASKDVMIEVQE